MRSVRVPRLNPVLWLRIVTWASGITAPLGSVMTPKTVASCVWDHPQAENKTNDRAKSKHALETHFVAEGKLPTITAMTYFGIGYNVRRPAPTSALGRLFCHALGQA